MSEEKMTLIEEATERYKKLPTDKQLFVLGFMQGVIIEHQEREKAEQTQRKVRSVSKKEIKEEKQEKETIVLNELRAKYGLSPVEGGDEPMTVISKSCTQQDCTQMVQNCKP